MGLKPARLKVFLVVLHAIQRDGNGGRLSRSQVAERALLSEHHAAAALYWLCDHRFLIRVSATGRELTDKAQWRWTGRTLTYAAPIAWVTSLDLADVHLEAGMVVNTLDPTPVGVTYLTPVGVTHSEYSEKEVLAVSFIDKRRDSSSEKGFPVGVIPPPSENGKNDDEKSSGTSKNQEKPRPVDGRKQKTAPAAPTPLTAVPNPAQQEKPNTEGSDTATSIPVPEPGKGGAENQSVIPRPRFGAEDRESLLVEATKQLHMARAASMSFAGLITPELLVAAPWPDREVTAQLLETFTSHADFQFWLQDTIARKLGAKVRESEWGLYLADARHCAPTIATKQRAIAGQKAELEAWCARREAERAAERQAALDAAARALETPMPLEKAWRLVEERLPDRGIPKLLKWRLKRTCEEITPNKLVAQISGWKCCHDCQDSGTLGSATEGNLRFCTCPAGIEAAYDPVYTPSGLKPDTFHKGRALTAG
jgi:hypothetical protein